MKTLLFVLGEENSGALASVKSQLSRLVPAHFELQPISSLDELKGHLPKTPCNIIILSADASQGLSTVVSHSREIVPTCSVVSLLENTTSFPKAFWGQDVKYVKFPIDEFSLSATLCAAEQESALRSRMLNGNKQDEVDNLLSRPYFMHRLSEEISIARRHKAPMCCVILSINYYRMYMDSYGYQFTNALLRFVGDELNKLVRYEDQVARVGDDELAMLLSRCSEADAKKLLQRMTDKLNKLRFQFGGYEEEVSVCAGVASYPFQDETPGTPDILIRYAHHALHQAKTSDDETCSVSLFSEIRPKL